MDSLLVRQTVDFVQSFFQNDFSGHDVSHTMRVYRLAVTLAHAERADSTIVSLAALLHDVDDRKLSPQTSDSLGNAVHFLRSLSLSEETIQTICKIIREVSFAGTDSVMPDTPEGKCVQDADRLDAIGAIGIARAFAYGGSHHRVMYDPEIPPREQLSREEYYKNENSTTVNHFYEKLLHLEALMNTETARSLARNRTIWLQNFLDEFFAEWNGER